MKTTPKQQQEFVERFRYYAHLLGVTNWEIQFEVIKEETNDGSILVNLDGRQATVYLNEEVSRKGKDAIDFIAAHEAIELFLAPARCLAVSRFTSKERIEEAFHQVVQGLLRMLGKKTTI